MNAIRYAISNIRNVIPIEILNRAFIDYDGYGFAQNVSLDASIEGKVITQRVYPDSNIVGGTMLVIPISSCEQIKPDLTSLIIKVPKSITGGRTIMSVHEISYLSSTALQSLNNAFAGMGANGNQADCRCNNNSDLMMASERLMNSLKSPPIMTSARAELIGENTIYIRSAVFNGSVYIRVMLANDTNFSNIQPRSLRDFAKLCEYATKAYIYNKLVIRIDTDVIKAGYSLGVLRDIIQSYSDSEQNYKDYLENEWARVQFMNDQPTHERYLRMISNIF